MLNAFDDQSMKRCSSQNCIVLNGVCSIRLNIAKTPYNGITLDGTAIQKNNTKSAHLFSYLQSM